MFRLAAEFINEFAGDNKETLLSEYLDRVHKKYNMSMDVLNRLLKSIRLNVDKQTEKEQYSSVYNFIDPKSSEEENGYAFITPKPTIIVEM